MTLAGLSRIPLTPFEHFAQVLVDARRRDRAVLLALLCYVALWTAYAVLAKGSQDLHFDMGELIAWSREPAFGYAKHPPFAAWLVKAWFSVFPLTDWAYYLLAVVNATVALWIAWIVSGRYLDGEKRAAGIALLTLVPFFNFHALKFNANTVLIPLWAATTWWFLRSFETRSMAFAALAGLGAGAAMLGKYWSVTLLAGLALAALADPRRRSYFASAAPWVTVAVGALVLAPHVAWLVAHDFAPFGYAAGHVASADFWSALVSTLGYVAGILGYIAAPIALAVALPVVATLAAPAVAIAILRFGGSDNGGTSRLLAGAIEQAWRASSNRPLGLIGGEGDTVYRVIPYLSGQPSTVDVIRPDRSPWADASRIAREGIALVCPASAVWCVQAIEARVARRPDARRTEVGVVVRRHLGVMGKPERYVIITIPPQP